ncbi:MAG: choice-of-anchor E domain-containing protein [Planctomycetes bacterium]|nr:choice-of-anchor E domain-containing protein [Planctomycetota bacterium]MCB9904228.1 choice-of-anchor E domain-containing protein [Planctomycetota bacterium]
MFHHLLNRGALALCGAALIAGTASAQHTQVESDSIALQLTNWDDFLTVPKFNVPGATLLSVDFTLDGGAEGGARIESLDAQPATVNTAFQATITLQRPDLTVIAVTLPVANFSDNLSAFDGTIDFGGTSGTEHLNIMASDSDMQSTSAPADLALFSGPGTISLPCKAQGSSTASGAGNLITQFNTSAEASVTVTYNYIFDCNGNQIDDAVDIQNGAPDLDLNGIPDECEPSIDRFCIGDGQQDDDSVPCPCGNVNANNLGGCTNFLGLVGTLSGSGNPSISNDTVQLTVSGIPFASPGWFFMSTSANPAGMVLGNGVGCLTQPQRVLKVQSGNGGGLFPAPGDPSISSQFGFTPGQTTYWQFWYRDQAGACNQRANATNALRIVWGL